MDRREFLQTSGLVAATAAYGASESPAIAGSNAPNSPIRVAQLKSPPPVTALDAPSVRKLLDAVAPLQPGAPGDTSDIPEILQPIDVGADALLTPFKNAALTYSPMEVEYLVNTLDDHITNCLNLREKAQQLEVLAVAQRLELRMEQKVIEFLTALAEFEKTNAPHVAASMFDPMVSGGQVSGSSSPEAIKFYDDRHSLEDIALQARREIAGARLSEMRRDGSGNHYVQRFNFIKESFNRELTEAYRRAQSIVPGLKAVYQIDTTMPEISNVGFLNKLALWHKEIFYQLERRVMKTTSTTLAVALRKGADPASPLGLIPDADYVTQRAATIFKFNLPANFFEQTTSKLKNPRLRGLEACAWTEANPKLLDYVRLRVDLPDQSIKTPTDTIWANNPMVTLPVVTFPQGSEFSFQARREVHNANPIGNWTIQVDKRTITDKETNKDDILRNIFLVMRISSDV